MDRVISCDRVTKRYGSLTAVNGVSLSVQRGEIFGLIGPNGAGKTTLVEMLESLRTPDEGSIRVLGLDPTRESLALRELIGIQLQATSIQANIRVREAINLFSALYRRPMNNPMSLLPMLGLEDKADSRFCKLSGGQKQRVAVALALINDPTILFCDEITTGLDPQARQVMWRLMRDIRGRGTTVFLTTHYMEEAEELCDRVAVIDHGRIIALDTPRNLVKGLRADYRITFTVRGRDMTAEEFAGLAGVMRAERAGEGFVVYTADDNPTLQALVRLADREGFRLSELRTDRPNLDDVFLALTGRELRT